MTDTLKLAARQHLQAHIATKTGLNRFLRVTQSGLLRIDKKAVLDLPNTHPPGKTPISGN